MAKSLLEGLTDKEIEALQEAISSKKRLKIDFDNMTDAERAAVNRTTQPVTPMVPFQEFPKFIYGNINGSVQAAEVRDEYEESAVREKFPNAGWSERMLDHGLETCPSKPSGPNARAFVTVGRAITDPAVEVTQRNDANPEPLRPLSWDEQLHPLAKRRPGRPPKPKVPAAA